MYAMRVVVASSTLNLDAICSERPVFWKASRQYLLESKACAVCSHTSSLEGPRSDSQFASASPPAPRATSCNERYASLCRLERIGEPPTSTSLIRPCLLCGVARGDCQPGKMNRRIAGLFRLAFWHRESLARRRADW